LDGGLDTAAAIAAFVSGVGIALTATFAPPVAALIAVADLIFGVVYEVVEFVTADVWTDSFDARMRCYLYECSSVTADVVTFDFQWLLDKLAEQTHAFDLDTYSIRLFGQVYYLLQMIGVDGLNYAGSATTLSGESCDCEWCIEWDFTVTSGAADGWAVVGTSGSYSAGVGWIGANLNVNSKSDLNLILPVALTGITEVDITYTKTAGGGANNVNVLRVEQPTGTVLAQNVFNTLGSDLTKALTGTFVNVARIYLDINSGTSTTTVKVTHARIKGVGVRPSIGTPC